MFMASREVYDLRHFGLRDFVAVDTANTDSAAMHMEHDACRLFPALVEKTLEHMNNELHRRVVVVEKKHLVHRGLLRLRLALDDDAGLQIVAADFVVVAHIPANCSPRQNQTRPAAVMIWDRRSAGKDPSHRIAQRGCTGTFWCLSPARRHSEQIRQAAEPILADLQPEAGARLILLPAHRTQPVARRNKSRRIDGQSGLVVGEEKRWETQPPEAIAGIEPSIEVKDAI